MNFRLYIYFITFISIISLLRAKKLCDVRIWYLNIITDGVFNLDLTHEQLLLKDSIESVVLKASESKETRMVDCSILHMYNDMLLDEFSYKSSGSGMTMTEIETEEKHQSDDNTVSDLIYDGLKDDTVKESHTNYGEGNVYDETEQSETTDNYIYTALNTDKAPHEFNAVDINDQDDTDTPAQTESVTEKQTAYNKDDENLFDTDSIQNLDESERNMVQTQDSENKNIEQEDKDEGSYVKETDEFQPKEVYNLSNKITNENLENNADNIDETEVIEDTGPLDAVSFSHTSEEVIVSQKINQKTKEPSEMEEMFVSKSIPFGVCWSLGCLVSDIFDVYSRKSEDHSDIHAYENANTLSNHNRIKKKKKWRCPVGPFCTMKCFYVFMLSNSFCMEDSIYEADVIKEEHNMHKDDDQDDVITSGKGEASNPTTDFHKTTETVNTLTNIHSELKTVKAIELEQENIPKNKEIHVQNTLFDGEVNYNHPTAVNDVNKWNVKEFENIVEERTSKYYSKLQTIEVMIMRLENQLLMEALNKQNHSSTITKLENQILRLENELLKMNKNYQTLREESVIMSKRQNKYLELAYKKARNEYPKLPDNSNVRYELISKHQDKINELSHVLRNHSSIIKQFREKHEALEDQTRILQQMVMNQTLFMSSIMKNVQDLTEQNIRNQQEINSLKQKLEKNLDKEKHIKDKNSVRKQNVIDQLENMVFNNMDQKFHQKQNKEVLKFEGNRLLNTENPVVYDMNYPKSQSSISTIEKWCPRDNRTCPSCHYTTVINSQCVPFQKIIWSKCEIDERAAESDFPTVPFVKDEQSDSTNDAVSSAPNDYLETVTSNQESQEKVYKHSDTSPSAENYQINDDQESFGEENGNSMQNVFENEELNRYQLVGYDKDGKPVLKLRDDLKQDENLARKDDSNSLKTVKTESENYVTGSQIQAKDNDEVVANEKMTENKNMTESPVYSENDTAKILKETKENTEIKMQVSQRKQERSNINIEKDIENNDSHESSLKSDVDPLSLKDTGEEGEKDIIKASESFFVNPEARKDISNSHKSILNDKSAEPPEESQKNKVLLETTNDLNKVNKQENPLSDPSQRHASTDDVGHENSLKGDVNHFSLSNTGEKGEKDVVIASEHLLDNPEETKDISTSHNYILNGKSAEPPKESQKNKVLPETMNDLNNVSEQENPRSDQNQQHTSASNFVGKKDGAIKNEKKSASSANKQQQRMIPINLEKNKQLEPKDCYDHYNRGERKDGLFKVKPLGSDRVIEVFCDMRRGGWTVIQRRQDGTTNFFQDWNDYKEGFGGLYGEHWLGNDNIHLLTNQDYYKLRVDLMDWEKNKKYAEFDYFLVEGEDQAYKLHIDGYTGDAGDGLTKHTGSMFSTKDVDNDKVVKEFGGSCAKRFYGAGWYYKCYASNLNGRFYKGGKIPDKRYDGITWKPWTGPNYSLKKVEMKLRPTSAG